MSRTRRDVNAMKTFLWALIAIALNVFVFWVVVGPWYPTNRAEMILIATLFGLPALGGFWMLYSAVRHEKRPLPFVLLAFVPFSFLWYYFERTRFRKASPEIVKP